MFQYDVDSIADDQYLVNCCGQGTRSLLLIPGRNLWLNYNFVYTSYSPCIPVAPVAPTVPGVPAIPDAPVAPTGPVAPVAPPTAVT